ncbi:DUF2760 domain-containing protein [bacterium]|nr:DUF2760 domain-containing protein [bacterium]
MHLIQAIKAFLRVFIHGDQQGVAAAEAPPATAFQGSTAPAIQVLGLLQKEGRLVDFLMEDISSFSDADVGAAVRQIHSGCRTVLDERFKLERVLQDDEGAAVEVPADFDASAISVIGNVSGEPPYKGTLNHRGWRAAETHLPTVPADADHTIVHPAEVEVV